jgi:hypothetical protein
MNNYKIGDIVRLADSQFDYAEVVAVDKDHCKVAINLLGDIVCLNSAIKKPYIKIVGSNNIKEVLFNVTEAVMYKSLKTDFDMRTIYVVTSGYYSDYRIEAVFDSEEEAEKLANEIEEGRVEEYLLNADRINDDRKAYDVYIENDNTNAKFCIDGDTSVELDEFQRINHCVVFSLLAKDKESAIKIASERYMQVKAQPYLFPDWDKSCVYPEDGRGGCIYPCYNFITRQVKVPIGYFIKSDK